ncbi:MAG: RHS repeat-associated core domain-containing protein, partial [Kiritimatiellia bacterium]
VAGNGTIRVAHSDELGRILALTDANGVLTDEYAYQPYGRLIAHSGTNDLPFAFMGDYGVWSAGNGLYLTRHRAYDANLMRFLQTDPIGLNGGYNLYAYANGAPSVFIDPLGLESRLNSAQQNIVNAANEWNATSPTWTPFNQCGQQAMALVTYLSGREEFSEWSFNILGGAVFGIENTYFTYGNHHVVEVRPAPWIKEDIGQPFTIDAFHEWYTIIPWIDWNTEVQVGSPDDFRETHPILFY